MSEGRASAGPSGSACRSIPDGFVEWIAGDSSETSYARSLYPCAYWDIVDIVAVVSKEKKRVSSTQGHQLASSSPFFEKRLLLNREKLKQVKTYLQEKNFSAFGILIEEEALELHAIYMTSHPSLIYLLPGTLAIMHMVKKWRAEGLEVYFTLNTGQDIHLICQKKDAKTVEKLLQAEPYVQKVIHNTPAQGAREVNTHLF
jgi:diphosphomevalonate decarboxylase